MGRRRPLGGLRPRRDPQIVDSEGRPLIDLIDGVKIRYVRNNTDERGTLCEIFRKDWKIWADPIPHIHLTTVYPGALKAWAYHRFATELFFVAKGMGKFALFDSRKDSPTCGKINEFVFGEANRAVLLIPPLVYHGYMNIASSELLIVVLRSRPYVHKHPDTFRIDPESNQIPYVWRRRAW